MKKTIFLLLFSLLLFSGCKVFQKTNRITVSCAGYSSFQITQNLIEGIKELNINFIDDTELSFIPSKDQINQIISSSLFIFSNQKNQKWISKEILSFPKKNLDLSKHLKNPKLCEEDFFSIAEFKKEAAIIYENLRLLLPSHSEKFDANYQIFLQNADYYEGEYKKLSESIEMPLVIFDRNPYKKLFSDFSIPFESLDKKNSNEKSQRFTYYEKSLLFNFIKTNRINCIYILKDCEETKQELKEKLKNEQLEIKILPAISFNESKENAYFSLHEKIISTLKPEYLKQSVKKN